MGYVPTPPGSDDPLDPMPGRSRRGVARVTTIVPDVDEDEDDGVPFEDELAGPALIVPPEVRELPAEEEIALPPPVDPPAPDPRELAKKLVGEARAKARAAAPQEPPRKKERAPDPEPEPPAPPARKRLADRAGRHISAEAALRQAAEREALDAKARKKAERVAAKAAAAAMLERVEAEESADAAPEPTPAETRRSKRSVEPAPAREVAPPRRVMAASLPPEPPEEPVAPPAPAAVAAPVVAPHKDPAQIITKLAPGATVPRVIVVSNAVVFRALWLAHRARAWATQDLALLATAAVLLDAVDRVPEGYLVAAHANIGGRDVAVWVDTARGVLLGVAEPPEVYLAGL